MIPFSFALIDVSICDVDLATADVQVQGCIDTCTIQSQPTVETYNLKSAELNGIVNNPIANCEGYPECVSICKAQISAPDPEDENANIGTLFGAAGSCLAATCPDAIQACENRKNQLQKEVNDYLYYSYKCVCESCILPGCRYQKLSSCKELTATCDEARKVAFGAGYGSSKKSWIGCNTSTTDIGKLTKIANTGLTKPKVNETPKITEPPKNTTKVVNTPKVTNPPTKTNTQSKLTNKQQQNKINNEQKINQIKQKPGFEVVEVNTKDGKKEIVLNNPDNSKLDAIDKHFYKKKKKIEGDIVDNTFGEIPGLGLWKDYVKKFFDDKKSDEQKTKQTQADLGIGANSAKQFNKMDGTGDTELGLSPAKNSIPSTPLTKPFEIMITQMGNTVKKTLAHGYNSEYHSALAHAKDARKYGMSWSETIKHTTNFLAEETDGKQWMTNVNSLSKKEFKTQESRVYAYLQQMRENGEVK